MADFNRDTSETMNHPDIIGFLQTCDDIFEDQTVTFESFEQDRRLIKFWPTSIILKWEEDRYDFLYVFWGTRLTTVYGLELTGKYIADGDHKDTENPFINAHLESMNQNKRIYLGGTIDWRDKGYQKWNQIIQPLSRQGKIRETLTYVTFD
jgi:hypothetical protein